ncbi:hypothetical protein ABEB36_004222 [Hypothenemus hampei]|uniref:Cysteine and histidine-rich domain-containing protein 1 n=1 Tax=Hypothenemus hampei TaxID=57062 RepID=A0ABD1F5S3_HYPHA
MATEEQCYNRGCGQKFDPSKNQDDACRHHPGEPFFHDAYKGWSCCKKKCTDFTEFLNISGCTVSKHSNVKPPEPEKPKVEKIPDTKVIEVNPISEPILERPPIDTPLEIIKPEIAPSLASQIENLEHSIGHVQIKSDEIVVGTSCKNNGCQVSYQGPETNNSLCLYHPGVPIFHEGLKFWSCCQRRTTDFNVFLNQKGCKEGNHVWIKDNDNTTVSCRWDYHQTGPYMIVSIYAKQYNPTKSVIKLNPIRLYVNLIFPQQNNAVFTLDIELKGIIDVVASKVTMYGTKVEIKLKKAEAGTWPKLEAKLIKRTESPKREVPCQVVETPKIKDVDLNDL